MIKRFNQGDTMLIQVDWYSETGKWKHGGQVEVKPLPWEEGIRKAILENQKEIVEGWENHDYYVVVNDIPESHNDPNYRMTYSRLYKPGDFINL
jgi:hypothetical protein